MADSTTLCLKCMGSLSFQPRVNLDLNLDTCSQAQMREMISLCNEDLDDYDDEISRLESQIIQVRAQKKRLIDYEIQIHFLLSSFHRFPNEVLSLIFESTCTENVFQEGPRPRALPVITYLPALAISSVCTRWRSLALVSPRLWSRIKLEIFYYEPSVNYDDTQSISPNEKFMYTMELYLDRSMDAPLAISVVSVDWEHNDSPALVLLLDHTHRWKSFVYKGEYELLDRLIGFDHAFPILETASLDSFGKGISGRADIAYFENAPNLHSIRTRGPICDVPLAWNHLTSLDTRLPEGEDLDLLRRYSALNILTLRSLRTPSDPGATSLSKVESFTFVTLHRYKRTPFLLLESIFPSFTFPSLKELILFSEIHGARLIWSIWSQKAFSAFISRSACNLTTFSLSNVKISDLDLIAALRLLPSLVKLNIDGLLTPDGEGLDGEGPITTHFISSLNGSSMPPLLPKLRFFSMKIHDTSFNDATFVDMVSSRWLSSIQAATIGIECLRSMVLCFSGRMVDAEVYKPLWQLDEMGMCVVITSAPNPHLSALTWISHLPSPDSLLS